MLLPRILENQFLGQSLPILSKQCPNHPQTKRLPGAVKQHMNPKDARCQHDHSDHACFRVPPNQFLTQQTSKIIRPDNISRANSFRDGIADDNGGVQTQPDISLIASPHKEVVKPERACKKQTFAHENIFAVNLSQDQKNDPTNHDSERNQFCA